ncbi:MAG: DUF6249 domain-containing protein [Bacteroidota bacterium]
MLDFITVPLVVGMITLGVYKLFELFVRKKERLTLIDRLGEKIDPSLLNNSLPSPVKLFGHISTGALKVGCLLMGIGLGLLTGLLITRMFFPGTSFNFDDYATREITGVIFGASVLLIGGLSLLVAFFIEMRYNKK